MAVKVAINGFGRIGRLVARIALDRSDMDLVAVNDLGEVKASAHLFKYDSLYGQYPGSVNSGDDFIDINGKKIAYLREKDPEKLPWKEMGVDVVVEGTGAFRTRDKAAKHLQAGAKKVVITAPGKNVDFTVVMGVNQEQYKTEFDIISNASCTTNCLAPVAKVLLDEFGIVKGMMTTVHSYTNDQRILDLAHNDFRRARAAAQSMIPTTTGAATAVGMVLPELKGKLDGMAIRVPTPTVSLVDLVVETEKSVSSEMVNSAFKKYADGPMQGIMKYTEEPLVSSDYRGESCSTVVDGLLTMCMGDKMVKVIAWYDNEWAYSMRVVDLVSFIISKGL